MFPREFENRMKVQLGNEYLPFVNSYNTLPPVSLRINPFKHSKVAYSQTVPWCSTGYYLPSRPHFAHDPAWHAGAYYVQEASSMVLEQVIRQHDLQTKPIKVLDLCAAPGGKSTHLASLLDPQSLILCNEVIPKRYHILKENLIKWGAPNVFITNSNTNQLSHLKEFFDVLLIDAPCSGEGLFRKNPEAIKAWSTAHCVSCRTRQQKIFDEAIDLLAPNGIVVYSTCTFNPGENLELLNDMASRYRLKSLDLSHLDKYGFSIVEKRQLMGIQSYPHKVKGEGFFIGALQKGGKIQSHVFRKRKIVIPSAHWSNQMFSSDHGIIDFKKDDKVYGIAKPLLEDFLLISSGKARIESILLMGIIKGKDLIPSHSLALCHLPKRTPIINLDREESLQYLRKQPLEKKEIQKGWTLVSFEKNCLGWIKVLDKRINNYYPAIYRLRK